MKRIAFALLSVGFITFKVFGVQSGWDAPEGKLTAKAGVGGVLVQGDKSVSASPVIKGDLMYSFGILSAGFSMGQALHFNQRDSAVSGSLRGGLNATRRITIINDNDTTNNITNVYQPIVSQVSESIDPTEQDYFFFEPGVSAGYTVYGVHPYVKGFYGTSGVKYQEGGRNWGTSYGYGIGVDYGIGAVVFGIEILKRKIEVDANSYDHLQITGGAGVKF